MLDATARRQIAALERRLDEKIDDNQLVVLDLIGKTAKQVNNIMELFDRGNKRDILVAELLDKCQQQLSIIKEHIGLVIGEDATGTDVRPADAQEESSQPVEDVAESSEGDDRDEHSVRRAVPSSTTGVSPAAEQPPISD